MPADVYPRNYSETVRALHSPHRSHRVWLSSRCHRVRNRHLPEVFDVTGPTGPGQLLTLEVWSGLPRLRVLSGNVSIVLASDWGNSVTILPAAAQTTRVHVQTGCKAHVQGADSQSVTGDLARTFLSDYRPEPVPSKPAQDCPF